MKDRLRQAVHDIIHIMSWTAFLNEKMYDRKTIRKSRGNWKSEDSRETETYWRCQCDCGNTCTVEDSHLKNGHTKNCGCRRRIRLQEKCLDLTGQRYGRLVVLGPAAELTEKRKVRWSKVDRPKVIARIVRAGWVTTGFASVTVENNASAEKRISVPGSQEAAAVFRKHRER